MPVTHERRASWQRDVDRIDGRTGGKRALGLFELIFRVLLQVVERLPAPPAFFRRRRPEFLEGERDLPALSRQVPVPHGTEIGRVRDRGDIALNVALEFGNAHRYRQSLQQEARRSREQEMNSPGLPIS